MVNAQRSTEPREIYFFLKNKFYRYGVERVGLFNLLGKRAHFSKESKRNY